MRPIGYLFKRIGRAASTVRCSEQAGRLIVKRAAFKGIAALMSPMCAPCWVSFQSSLSRLFTPRVSEPWPA